MTDLVFDNPCLLFALRREAAPFLREFRPQQRFPGAPGPARFCGPAWLPLLILETGVGPARSAAVAEWLFGRPRFGNVSYRPKLVISAGFSGALHKDLQVGDIVLSTEVVDEAGEVWRTTWPGDLPAGERRPPLRRGRILAMSQLMGDPEVKQELGRRHDALAVDMETATVARLCSVAGIPFGCLRAISDDLATPLSPRLLNVLAGGGVSLPRLLLNLAASPRLAAECWRLAWQTRHAAEQLARALGELLALTRPGAEKGRTSFKNPCNAQQL